MYTYTILVDIVVIITELERLLKHACVDEYTQDKVVQ